jgi:hypothetical protein
LSNRSQNTQSLVSVLRLARALVPEQGFGIAGIRLLIQLGVRRSW